MIALGLHFGGPEFEGTPIKRDLKAAMNIVENSRGGDDYNDGVSGWINPIFIVPGLIWQPDFQGQKRGYFSKKEKGLVIQIVVPASVIDENCCGNFIASALREAVQTAHAFFSARKISFSTLKAEAIIMAVETGLSKRDV